MSCKAHKPDWRTIQPVPGMPGVVDVWCSACGQRGSFSVLAGDVHWEYADDPEPYEERSGDPGRERFSSD